MHFVHRGLAYLIVLMFAVYCWRYNRQFSKSISTSFWIFGGLILVQITLGVITLLESIGHIPVLWGVLHQGVAVLVIASLFYHYYLLRYTPY